MVVENKVGTMERFTPPNPDSSSPHHSEARQASPMSLNVTSEQKFVPIPEIAYEESPNATTAQKTPVPEEA